MFVDLAAAAQMNAPTGGSARAVWTGGKIAIDVDKFLDLVVRAVSFTMGNNLFNGRRPDGRGPMPARKYDGQARGTGALIARALLPVKVGKLTWVIAAHREKVGHLARLMGDVPLLAPPIDAIRAAVHSAFVSALSLSAHKASTASLSVKNAGTGTAARAARAAARSTSHALRDAYRSQLGALGLGGPKAERSALGRRIASASRRAVRRAR